MITLYGFGAGFGLPEISPFVTKTEVQLKMAGLAYRKEKAMPPASPKGQLPYIVDEAETHRRFHLHSRPYRRQIRFRFRRAAQPAGAGAGLGVRADDRAPCLLGAGRRARPLPAEGPGRRYRRAEDLLYDLEALRDETQRPRVKTAPPLAAAQAAAGGGAATTSPPPPERAAASPIEQEIRFCLTADGASIAYATVGDGAPPIVRSLGWFTHLELEWKWAAGREFWERLARRHRLVRYDGRGMGLSQAKVEALGHEQRLLDLEAVVDAAGLERFALMGMSEGGQTAIAYAARHPERVSHLVLYGHLVDQTHLVNERDKWRALIQIMKPGWGQEIDDLPSDLPTHALHLSGHRRRRRQVAYFNEMQRVSATAATASPS